MSNSNPRRSRKKAKDDEAADTVDQSQLPAGDEDERDKECYYCGVTGVRRKGSTRGKSAKQFVRRLRIKERTDRRKGWEGLPAKQFEGGDVLERDWDPTAKTKAGRPPPTPHWSCRRCADENQSCVGRFAIEVAAAAAAPPAASGGSEPEPMTEDGEPPWTLAKKEAARVHNSQLEVANLLALQSFDPTQVGAEQWQLWCGRVAGRAKEAVRLQDVEPGERRTTFDLLVGSDCLAVQDLYNLSCCCTALQDMVHAQPAYQEKLVCRMFSRMVRLRRKEEELARVKRDAEARAERVAQQAPQRADETDADRSKRERSEAQQARRHKASVAERRAHKIRADRLEKTVEQLESALSEMEGELDFTARRLRTVERREGTLGDSMSRETQADTMALGFDLAQPGEFDASIEVGVEARATLFEQYGAEALVVAEEKVEELQARRQGGSEARTRQATQARQTARDAARQGRIVAKRASMPAPTEAQHRRLAQYAAITAAKHRQFLANVLSEQAEAADQAAPEPGHSEQPAAMHTLKVE